MKRKGSPTEESILNVLSDGEFHSREELYTCLPDTIYLDDAARCNALKQHIYRLRKGLEPKGHTIETRFFGKQYSYRWVRLLVNPCK